MADSTSYAKYAGIVGAATGVTSLNSLTGALTLVAGTGITITPAGSNITIASTSGGDVTIGAFGSTPNANGLSINGSQVLNLQPADATHPGGISISDWNTFNNKQNALTFGNLTDAGTDGITVTGGTGAVIGTGTSLSQHVADSAHNGYLSSVDWTTFNNKQSTLTLTNLTDVGTDGITITNGTGAVIGASPVTLSQHVADTTHNGYLSSTDWNTFNGKQAAGNYITALTGDVTATGPGSVASTVAKIQGTTVSGTTGTTNVVFSAAPTVTGVATFTNWTSSTTNPATAGQISLAKTDAIEWRNNANSANSLLSVDVSDNLQWRGMSFVSNTALLASAFPAFTGDITTSAGSVATTAAATQNNITSIPNLATVGTIGTGTWQGTTVASGFGGTGFATYTKGDILYCSATNVLSKLGIGSTGNLLTVAAGVPSWAAPATSGTVTSVALSVPASSLFSVSGSPVTSSGTLALATAGTSGGIPYFSSTTQLNSSALLTANGVVYGGGAGAAPVATAAGTTGQVLIGTTSAAPSWATTLPIAALASQGAIHTTTFTTASTSSTSTIYYYICVGGGGGGGGTNGATAAAGGGGAGGVSFGTFTGIAASVSVTIATGAAGTAGTNAGGTGGTGGTSSITATGITTITCNGGVGGTGSTTTPQGGGAGGTASGGTLNASGGAGFPSITAATEGGTGGYNAFGQGGAAGNVSILNAGAAGSGWGGGGGGAVNATSVGGAGAAGIVMVIQLTP